MQISNSSENNNYDNKNISNFNINNLEKPAKFINSKKAEKIEDYNNIQEEEYIYNK
jgi:hypothetical protein